MSPNGTTDALVEEIEEVMDDGAWFTYGELRQIVPDSEASDTRLRATLKQMVEDGQLEENRDRAVRPDINTPGTFKFYRVVPAEATETALVPVPAEAPTGDAAEEAEEISVTMHYTQFNEVLRLLSAEGLTVRLSVEVPAKPVLVGVDEST